MPKEMLINVSEGEECRIALVENGRLDELYMERTSSTSHVGNIYKGRVTNVEPSIQAAFIDFGLGRNGFLHVSDLMPTYFGRAGEDVKESVGRKMARRDRPPIQRCLRRGDDIIVQIIKEGIGTKGPTLSTYISIPGRILVMMPGMSKLGVSRKIEDEEERRRLRKILDELKPPRDAGFIIRTAGVGKPKLDIQKDLQFLTRLWQNIDKKIKSGPGPMELYTEGDLVTRTVRDVFTPDIDTIIVDNKDVEERVRDFMKIAMPRAKENIVLHDEAVPLFHKYGIEREIELMYSRHVPLPSGGSLVIDSTEAVVAIDVNSGKFRDHSDAEMTAFKTDMEAADEIARQLRLRDLGGVIICDFIDLRYERHRRDLEKRLHDHLKNDRAKTKMLRMSQFGIIEMTRQRMRPSLKRSVYFDCPHCKGAGLVKTTESMALDVMRRLAIAVSNERVQRAELTVCNEVAHYVNNRKRAALVKLEQESGKRIAVRQDPHMGMDETKLDLFDARDGLVYLDELGMAPPAQTPHVAQRGGQPQQPQQQRGQQPQRGGPQQGGGRPQQGQQQQRGDQRGGRGPQPGRGGDQRGGGGARDRDQQGRRDQQPAQQGRDQGRDQGRGGGGGREGGSGRDQGRGGRDQGRGGRDQQRQQQEHRHDPREDREEMESTRQDDRFDIDRVEDAVEEREAEILSSPADEMDEPIAAPAPIEEEGEEVAEPVGRRPAFGEEDDDDDARDREDAAEARDERDDDDQPVDEEERRLREAEASEAGDPVQQARAGQRPVEAQQGGGGGGGGGGGRRGRRRGRRGRGRGRDHDQQQQPSPQAEPVDDEGSMPEIDPAPVLTGQAEVNTEEPVEAPVMEAPSADTPAETPAEEAKPKKKTRRGTRGGRGRKKKPEAGEGETAVAEKPAGKAERPAAKAPAKTAKKAAARPRRKPPAASTKAEAAAAPPSSPTPRQQGAPVAASPIRTVVRGAAADKHLVNDEPVEPQPAQAPKSFRDLDHIDEDYD